MLATALSTCEPNVFLLIRFKPQQAMKSDAARRHSQAAGPHIPESKAASTANCGQPGERAPCISPLSGLKSSTCT
eukprot:1242776-Pleurochrysis_carterae.AAC.1